MKNEQENSMEKIARSSNVKRKLRDASPKAVFDYEISKGYENKVQAEQGRRSALDENNVMRKDRFYTGNKRKINFKNTGGPQTRPSEAIGNTPQDAINGNQFKQNVLARRGSRRIFAESIKNTSPEDREGIAGIMRTRSEQIRRRNQDFGHIQQTLGKKKLVGGEYKSPKEQWKSTNNAPKPKMNIYGKPLDPSAPKSTFTKKASDEGKEMKKEAKSKNIGQRLMEASKSARQAYENSKKARSPKDFDPTKAVHEHHNTQYEKPKNIGTKPKIKSIDDFLNNTFY